MPLSQTDHCNARSTLRLGPVYYCGRHHVALRSLAVEVYSPLPSQAELRVASCSKVFRIHSGSLGHVTASQSALMVATLLPDRIGPRWRAVLSSRVFMLLSVALHHLFRLHGSASALLSVPPCSSAPHTAAEVSSWALYPSKKPELACAFVVFQRLWHGLFAWGLSIARRAGAWCSHRCYFFARCCGMCLHGC